MKGKKTRNAYCNQKYLNIRDKFVIVFFFVSVKMNTETRNTYRHPIQMINKRQPTQKQKPREKKMEIKQNFTGKEEEKLNV